MSSNTTYSIIAKQDRTFHVIMDSGGGAKAVTGFGSEHEATAWIEQTKRMRQMSHPKGNKPQTGKYCF